MPQVRPLLVLQFRPGGWRGEWSRRAALAVRMIPKDVLCESRQKAREMVERGERPVSRAAAAVIVVLWLALAVLGALVAVRMIRG